MQYNSTDLKSVWDIRKITDRLYKRTYRSFYWREVDVHAESFFHTSPFRWAKSTARTTSPIQHVRPPGFCHCWSVRLEQSSGPCPQSELHWSCFQAPAKNCSHGTSAPRAFAGDVLYKLTHWHLHLHWHLHQSMNTNSKNLGSWQQKAEKYTVFTARCFE